MPPVVILRRELKNLRKRGGEGKERGVEGWRRSEGGGEGRVILRRDLERGRGRGGGGGGEGGIEGR